MAVDVTVLLVNYNTRHLLETCFGQLQAASRGLASQTIVVDNASADNSIDFIRRHWPDWELIANPRNVGFGRANNQALPRVEGRYLLLLNTDAFVAPDTLEKTVAYMDAHPRCGILGVRLVGRDGELQPCARYFPTPWNLFLQRNGLARFFPRAHLIDDLAWPHDAVRHCDWVPGCYYLVRRELIDQVGLFDPRYFLYYEEVDHCLAARRAGWEVTFFPHTSVVHLGGESARSDGEITPSGRQIEALQIESELLYFRKNHGLPAVLADVALILAGDALRAARRILQGRPAAPGAHWNHARRVLSLFHRTRWGTRPTQ
ncbi:MAG: putative Glycosyl transferase, family 2 [Rhodocyclaceae bacterium]|nr:putative Glycosyl transferase, family 2 [Rhodocyclaceae bacterium]